MVAAIHERHVIQADDGPASEPRDQRPEHLINGRIGVRAERAESSRDLGHGNANARVAVERDQTLHAIIMTREQHLLLTRRAERSMDESEWSRAIGGGHGVASPTRRDKVETSVAVEVTRGEPVP